MGSFVATLIVVGVSLGAISLSYWATKRLTTRLFSKAVVIPAWLWLWLFIAPTLLFWLLIPKKGGLNPPPASIDWTRLGMAVGLGAVCLSLAIAYVYRRGYDPGLGRARKRADDGDLDGAIAELREQIEDKGATQNRLNTLGLLLLRAERWDEAAASFQKAEAHKGLAGICRANFGVALLRGGKPEEALQVFRDAALLGPGTLQMACILGAHHARALIALGRWDEARHELQAAEAAAVRLSREQRRSTDDEFKKLHLELAKAPLIPEKSESLDER